MTDYNAPENERQPAHPAGAHPEPNTQPDAPEQNAQQPQPDAPEQASQQATQQSAQQSEVSRPDADQPAPQQSDGYPAVPQQPASYESGMQQPYQPAPQPGAIDPQGGEFAPPQAGAYSAGDTASFGPQPPAFPGAAAQEQPGQPGAYQPGQPGAYQQAQPGQPGAYPQQVQTLQQAPQGGYPGAAVPPAGPRKGMPKWAWWVIGGGVLLILIIVALIVTVVAVNAANSPSSTAQSYVTALSKGDAKTANSLARLNASSKDNALLTDSVLSKASHISDPKIERTVSDRSGSRALVQVSYKLDGKSLTTTLGAEKDSKGWYIRNGLTTTVPYLEGVPEYGVKGSTTSIDADSAELLLYPGVYTLTSPSGLYTLSGASSITVAPTVTTHATVKATPSQKYLDQVNAAVKQHVDQCLATTTKYFDVDACGIYLEYPDNMMTSTATVKVQITQYPKATAGGSDGQDIKIDGGSVTATLTGTDFSLNPATATVSGDFSDLAGSVKVVDGKVQVKFY